jgi:hypothetical protein
MALKTRSPSGDKHDRNDLTVQHAATKIIHGAETTAEDGLPAVGVYQFRNAAKMEIGVVYDVL